MYLVGCEFVTFLLEKKTQSKPCKGLIVKYHIQSKFNIQIENGQNLTFFGNPFTKMTWMEDHTG